MPMFERFTAAVPVATPSPTEATSLVSRGGCGKGSGGGDDAVWDVTTGMSGGKRKVCPTPPGQRD